MIVQTPKIRQFLLCVPPYPWFPRLCISWGHAAVVRSGPWPPCEDLGCGERRDASLAGIHLDVTSARDASVSSAALHRRIPPLGLRGDWKEAALAETHTAAEQSAQRLPHVAHVPHGSAGKAPAPWRQASSSCLPAPPRRAAPFLAPQLAQRRSSEPSPSPTPTPTLGTPSVQAAPSPSPPGVAERPALPTGWRRTLKTPPFAHRPPLQAPHRAQASSLSSTLARPGVRISHCRPLGGTLDPFAPAPRSPLGAPRSPGCPPPPHSPARGGASPTETAPLTASPRPAPSSLSRTPALLPSSALLTAWFRSLGSCSETRVRCIRTCFSALGANARDDTLDRPRESPTPLQK